MYQAPIGNDLELLQLNFKVKLLKSLNFVDANVNV